MYGDTRILQNWQPSEFSDLVIRTELAGVVEAHLGPFRAENWTVRNPKFENPYTNTRWHHDTKSEIWMIAWSNIIPTEFENGFSASAGDVILIRDQQQRHRSPVVQDKDRWFVQFWNITPRPKTSFGKRFK